MTKDELREKMRALRRALTAEQISSKSRAISDFLINCDEYKKSETIMIYLSSFKEPDTAAILSDSLSDKRVVVPVSVTDTHTIIPSLLRSSGELKKGAYGIREPENIIPVSVNEIDTVLVPGIAFDNKGARIGFGAGYYDRFLSQFNGIKIGICYDFQITENIPVSPHDIFMDMIITEKRIYNDF